MSDTPRTDALLAQFHVDGEGRDHDPPFAELARTLERELLVARATAGQLHADLYGMQDGALLRDLRADNARLREHIRQFVESKGAGSFKKQVAYLARERERLERALIEAQALAGIF